MDLGLAIRLMDEEVRNSDGRLDERKLVLVREKAVASLVDIGLRKQAVSGIEPRVRIRQEPRRLMFDLIVKNVDPHEALAWRTNAFSLGAFRANVEEAITVALQAWSHREFDVVVWADDSGIRKTTDKDQSVGVHAVSR